MAPWSLQSLMQDSGFDEAELLGEEDHLRQMWFVLVLLQESSITCAFSLESVLLETKVTVLL